MPAIPVSEIRDPNGTLLARWLGEGNFDWGAWQPPGEWELWRDGEKLARYWRVPTGWAWEVF